MRKRPTECDNDCEHCLYDECVKDPGYIKEIEHSRKYQKLRQEKLKAKRDEK